jgi:diguanylate cyclase (GGDEF)-like protein
MSDTLSAAPPETASVAERLHTLADLLDGVDIGLCAFDDDDRVMVANRSFFVLFPEHQGFCRPGEPYRDNLRRFYRARLKPEELAHLDDYVEAGVQRHRTQTRPYVFDHRGRRLRVHSLAMPGVGRLRLWRAEVAPADGLPPHGTLTPAAGVPVDAETLLDQIPDGLSLSGPDGRIRWVNDPFMAMYAAYDRHRVLGLDFPTLYAQLWSRMGRDHDSAYRETAATLAERLRFPGAPFELPLPGGRTFRLIARALPDGGCSLAHVDVSELVSQRRRLEQAERAARESEERLRLKSRLLEATLEHMEQGIVMIGSDGMLALWNQRVEELLDLRLDAFGPRPSLDDLMQVQRDRGDFDGLPEEVRRYLERGAGDRRPFAFERETPAGKLLWISSVPVEGLGLLRTYTDITERREQESRIRHAATHDGLTGLINRATFMECLAAEVAMARRHPGAACAVLFLDLDGFKPINDSHGHAVGDLALRWAAATVQHVARESDFVARLGGDEFAVLQRGVPGPEHSLAMARRILSALAQPFRVEGLTLQLGVSIGIAFCPEDAQAPDELMRQADAAMYAAKAAGRHRARLASDLGRTLR